MINIVSRRSTKECCGIISRTSVMELTKGAARLFGIKSVKIGKSLVAELAVVPVLTMAILSMWATWISILSRLEPRVVINPASTKFLHRLVFALYFPCLNFTQRGARVALENMIKWRFIPVNVVFATAIGRLAGYVVTLMFRPRPRYYRFICMVFMIGIGNAWNLPLAIISSICHNSNSPSESTCRRTGVPFVFFSMWMCVTVVSAFIYHWLEPLDDTAAVKWLEVSTEVMSGVSEPETNNEKAEEENDIDENDKDDYVFQAQLTLQRLLPDFCLETALPDLRALLVLHPYDTALELAVNRILEHELPAASSCEPAQRNEGTNDAPIYEDSCLSFLEEVFPQIQSASLRYSLRYHGGDIVSTYLWANSHDSRATTTMKITEPADNNILWEMALPNVHSEDGGLEANEGQKRPLKFEELVECGCCYLEFDFERLLQCSEGHLFCSECIRRHFEGHIFGASQPNGLPSCLHTEGCNKTFPLSEVQRALPADVLVKFEQRQAEDSVARAKLEGLVYCPFCDYPWEVDPGTTILNCHNPACSKASCIECKKPNHHPKTCYDVEKKSETSVRKEVEESMTRALIRNCTSCRAKLVKKGGCNKVTCKCGQMMCYVCRKDISNYSHFCQHKREKGKPCKHKDCSGCSCWEKENETAVVKAAKQAAIQNVRAKKPDFLKTGFLKRDIGPSDFTA